MGKSSSSPPPAPDPKKVAKAQGEENLKAAIASARMNQINEVTPFGTATYQPTGKKIDGIDQFERVVELSPEQQQILDQSQALNTGILGIGQEHLGQVGDALSDPLSLEGLPAAPEANDETRQRVEDALYERTTSRLDPRYDDQLRKVQTQLANQGFSVGSEGYTRALGDFRRSENDAYQAAMNEAIMAGGQEQSRLFGLESTARQNALQEMLLERTQPLNELATLMGQSEGVSVPQFSGIPQTQVPPADVAGPTALQYQSQLNAYNQEQQDQRSLLGSIFGLGGAALGGWASSL